MFLGQLCELVQDLSASLRPPGEFERVLDPYSSWSMARERAIHYRLKQRLQASKAQREQAIPPLLVKDQCKEDDINSAQM